MIVSQSVSQSVGLSTVLSQMGVCLCSLLLLICSACVALADQLLTGCDVLCPLTRHPSEHEPKPRQLQSGEVDGSAGPAALAHFVCFVSVKQIAELSLRKSCSCTAVSLFMGGN